MSFKAMAWARTTPLTSKTQRLILIYVSDRVSECDYLFELRNMESLKEFCCTDEATIKKAIQELLNSGHLIFVRHNMFRLGAI